MARLGVVGLGKVGLFMRDQLVLKTPLLPYQPGVVEEIEDFNGRCLLALEPGLGKTICSLAYWQRHPEIKRVVVVCPASAQWHWEREAKRHLGVRCEVLEGRYKKRKCLVETGARLFVLSYDVLLRQRKREFYSWVPYLVSLKPGIIIFDEVHLLSGRGSQRTRASQELVKCTNRVLALSGTPLTNRPSDLWPILNILRPDKWDNFYRFGHQHCDAKYNPRYKTWDFRGASNIKKLHASLRRHVLVRRRKVDVLKDLPPKQINVIPLDLANRKEYTHAVRDFLGWLREKSPSRAARAAKTEEYTKIGYLLRLAGEGKLKADFEWIDNFLASGEKLLVFAIHKKVISALEERYKGICVKVDGSVTGRKRQRAFDQFNKSDTTQLLLGNMDAAGTVWSCTATSDVAFCELPWVPGKLDQAIDRARGVNRGIKGKKTRAWLLVAHSTIEEKLCEILQRKQRIITSTLDGGRVRNELEIFDQLLLELEKEEK